MRIEIIGGMGVGKTTLCRALENHSLRCIYESLEKNPYLGLSYEDPGSFGFYSQISFILGNFYTAARAAEKNAITFLDFSTITDKAYASLFLDGKARSIALQTVDYLEEKEGRADLYLYLTCSAETQLQRIRGRSRPHEKGVGLEFIQKLDALIARFVHMAELQGCRVLSLDVEDDNVRYDQDYITSLTMKVRQVMQAPASWPQVNARQQAATANTGETPAAAHRHQDYAEAV